MNTKDMCNKDILDILIEVDGNKFTAIKKLMENEGKSRDEAITLVNDALHRIDSYNPKACITFKEFTDVWNNDYAKVVLKKASYVSHLRNLQINFDTFNNLELHEINKQIIQRWISWLHEEKKIKPKTIRNNYSILHSILDKAVMWGYLSDNPAKYVCLPKLITKESDFYNAEEVKKLLAVLNATPEKDMNFKVGILIGLFGGLRKGEILGIDIDDIDFEKSAIRIHQSRIRCDSTGLYVSTPKTKKSVRTVVMPASVMKEIKKLIQYNESVTRKILDSGGEVSGTKALIRNNKGEPLYPQMLYKWFKKLQWDNDLPEICLHGLRHTHTSMMLENGGNLEDVSRRLGHSQKSTTINIYSHMFVNHEESLVESISARFFNE